MIADGRGRAIAFALAPGQAHELPLAPGLLGRFCKVGQSQSRIMPMVTMAG